jgi:hypothetical protein
MPTKKPKPKKKPVDSTLRNVRAANKRIKALEDCIRVLQNDVDGLLIEAFDRHESLVRKLKKQPTAKGKRK